MPLAVLWRVGCARGPEGQASLEPQRKTGLKRPLDKARFPGAEGNLLRPVTAPGLGLGLLFMSVDGTFSPPYTGGFGRCTGAACGQVEGGVAVLGGTRARSWGICGGAWGCCCGLGGLLCRWGRVRGWAGSAVPWPQRLFTVPVVCWALSRAVLRVSPPVFSM